MISTMSASTRKTETGLQAEAESRGFKVILDEPEEMGGSNTGMNPVEMTLCAFSGCLTILAHMMAQKMRMNIEDIRVDVEGDVDTDGLAGVKGVRSGLSDVRYTFHFKTSESEKKIDRLVSMVEAYCPVHDTLSNPVNVVRKDIVIE